MNSAAALLVLLAGATAFNVDFSDAERPITKVIGLLQDMSAQLEKEAAADEEMYEKMGCWCETNDKEKTKAIEDANHKIAALTSAIEGFTSKDAMLASDIEKLNVEIAKMKDALDQATAIRTKENGEFSADEKDMMANGASLKGAVEALGAAHGAALSQKSLIQIQGVIRKHMQEHKKIFHVDFAPKHHRILSSFLQSTNTYEPASGAIFGILKQMKESFETNLVTAQKEEAQAAAEYGELRKSKMDQITSAATLMASKTTELADTKDKNAMSKQDLSDTEKQLAADSKFLEKVKSTCATADADYEARQKVRGEEIQAVSETIGILTSDEAQSSFSKSMSFIQMSLRTRRVTAQDRMRERAAHLLRQAAVKSGSAQLSQLATQVRVDAFAEVKKAIDEMMAELKKTQKEEADKYEYCTTEIKENDKERAEKTDYKADLETNIADLTAMTEKLGEEITQLKAAVLNAQIEMKKASENREAENNDFQVTVADQKATQAILTKALDRLKSFYAAKLLQTATAQTPPAQGTYKKSAGATGVTMMIEAIIKESADVEKKALNSENEAQKDYEEFIVDSNASVDAMTGNIVSKSEAQAKAEKEKIAATDDRSATIETLLKLGEVNVGLHQSCDFLIKNFDVRQSARAEEIESLFNAKAIFSGANYGFLQQQKQ